MTMPEAICGTNTNLHAWAKADGYCQDCRDRKRQAYWFKGTLFGGTPQPGYGDLALCGQCAATLRGCVAAASSFVDHVRVWGGHKRKQL